MYNTLAAKLIINGSQDYCLIEICMIAVYLWQSDKCIHFSCNVFLAVKLLTFYNMLMWNLGFYLNSVKCIMMYF